MKCTSNITLLDLGGVVFQSTGISNQYINWTIISELNAMYSYDLNIGKNKFPDFMNDYNAKTQQDLQGTVFLKELFDTLTINTELIDAIRQVSEIIIVSDNYRENIEYISKRYDFDQWSVAQIYSFHYNMQKENPLFFKHLLEDLNEYSASNLVFIDDSLEKLDSASQHNIPGIYFHDNDQTIKELTSIFSLLSD